MEAVRTIRADRRIEGVDPGIARCTGQITVRFENTTLLAQAQAGTSAEFGLAFTIDANRSLTITLHEVYLALAKTPIEGPAGVEAIAGSTGKKAPAVLPLVPVSRAYPSSVRDRSSSAQRWLYTYFGWKVARTAS
jgi:hypothetical protein